MKPVSGPLSASGGREDCVSIENLMVGVQALVQSVDNALGQLMQDVVLETTAGGDGG